MSGSPAFKEWQVIVGALEAGEQILILRKGGISEGREGFTVCARRFWLFPTRFHAQRFKTKAGAHRHFNDNVPARPDSVALSSYAEVVHAPFLSDWKTLERLDAQHAWTTDTVRDRFNSPPAAGLHALVVRVFKLQSPVTLSLSPEMGGCRSWISLPESIDAHVAHPVLDDAAFERRWEDLRRSLEGGD